METKCTIRAAKDKKSLEEPEKCFFRDFPSRATSDAINQTLLEEFEKEILPVNDKFNGLAEWSRWVGYFQRGKWKYELIITCRKNGVQPGDTAWAWEYENIEINS